MRKAQREMRSKAVKEIRRGQVAGIVAFAGAVIGTIMFWSVLGPLGIALSLGVAVVLLLGTLGLAKRRAVPGVVLAVVYGLNAVVPAVARFIADSSTTPGLIFVSVVFYFIVKGTLAARQYQRLVARADVLAEPS